MSATRTNEPTEMPFGPWTPGPEAQKDVLAPPVEYDEMSCAAAAMRAVATCCIPHRCTSAEAETPLSLEMSCTFVEISPVADGV